ncbi:hypothetical protein ACFQI7_18825 [Paenibacillus allorhizosphaerae]|uniref:Uncharacterized protein n=1 Tax=Paenibacillus allorhizosphaerae TaxID=2849866 RepID=A0ABM8VSE6_9BACL|nr:hypothetical protein [Paenibacillus allorhizosphaerae]CAG7656467.1 hypothetical protein PAECIP111802_06413 [Paenibacillus allorhizosphaerae]
MNPTSIEHLIRKVSKYVSFGQPVSSGSVISQRISDPRLPILAYYLNMKLQNEQEQYYREVWLKKDGSFAITEAWYKDSSVTRKLYQDQLTADQLKHAIGEEELNSVILRMTEIVKKFERDDWKPQSRRM